MGLLDQLAMFGRYATGLGPFLRHTVGEQEAREWIERQLAGRVHTFLDILRRGIFRNPASPFRRLLEHARFSFDDVETLIAEHGLEGALGRLYDAGVYVTMNEFKGRQPIIRPGLEFAVAPETFDNPLLARQYELQTSGSRGVPARIVLDLDHLVGEAARYRFFLDAFELWGRPVAIWRPVPPVGSGLKAILRYAKVGAKVDTWFSQSPLSLAPDQLKFRIFLEYTIHAGRLFGAAIPTPRFVPRDQAHVIAEWLAARRAAGTPGVLETNGSAAVHVCASALERGLDISGSFFRLGGEPYTRGKAEIIARAGARAASHYHLSELSAVGLACAAPRALDEVHLMTDKLAVIQRGRAGRPRELLVFSTLSPSAPKLMLNVESDDYGQLCERDCGCALGGLGLRTHLSEIRSFEKLTSEGVTFLGSELLRLVEEVLPGRFGGYPSDYQLVESEEQGLPRIGLVISPRLGNLVEEDVLCVLLAMLREVPGGDVMSDQWRQAGTLRVVRGEPHATASGKVHPLHVMK